MLSRLTGTSDRKKSHIDKMKIGKLAFEMRPLETKGVPQLESSDLKSELTK